MNRWKPIIIALGSALALGACSTGQVANSKFACGGTSSMSVQFTAPSAVGAAPQLQSVELCMGTNGTDRRFVHRTFGADGALLKEITYGSDTTEATSALVAVGEVFRATSSNDATVSKAAIDALPAVLGAAVKIISPIPLP